MLLIQEPWSVDMEPAALAGRIAAIQNLAASSKSCSQELVLLPLAEPGVFPADELRGLFATTSRQLGVFLAGAALVEESAATHIRCLMAGPNGELLIDTAKKTPELTAGFADFGINKSVEPSFSVATTPEGRVGLLAGEDILMPHLARAQVLAGAEIILNPSRELSDQHLPLRLKARRARAYENLAYVATCSPRFVTADGQTIHLSSATQISDQWGTVTTADGQASYLSVNLDTDNLRQRRQEVRTNFPAIVRTQVYEHELDRIKPQANDAIDSALKWREQGQRRAPAIISAPIDNYAVALCQHVVHQSKTADELVPNRDKNLVDALDLAGQLSKAPNCKLVVLPEFFITGPVSPLGDQLSEHAEKIGITIPGPETQRLGEFARHQGVYLAAGCFEYDPDWPGRFFNTGFILNDQGELILKYRKLHCADVMGFLPDTTPGSVFTEYVARYGHDALFPVVDTPLGQLAVTICFDMNFPETYRALAHRGAEVIIHPTSEPHNRGRAGWELARHVRAFENLTYILSCGHGGEYFGSERTTPTARARGYSRIVDFNGRTQVVADGPGRIALPGTIELQALRQERAKLERNFLLWDDPSLYRPYYGEGMGIPNDLWREDPSRNPYRNGKQIRAVINDYNQRQIFVSP
ncbi:MAG: nitrilase-related carbon-nitrogen hydrolase [Gammaproteobacteria bacterium]